MPLLADTHVHLYPCHDAGRLFTGARDRLRRLVGPGGPPVSLLLCFTERHDCHAFRDLRDGRRTADPLTIQPAGPGALRLEQPGQPPLLVLCGRQVNTRERLEILALGTDADLPDGEPIRDTIARVRDAGGRPALAWAPGKWFFGRGKVVTRLLEESAPGTLLVGDSTLRPTLWPTPDLMSYASLKGLKVIAGSDPLPAPGEERMAGDYATFFHADLDEADPAASFLRVLDDPDQRPVHVGRRSPALVVWQRLRAYKKARSAPSA